MPDVFAASHLLALPSTTMVLRLEGLFLFTESMSRLTTRTPTLMVKLFREGGDRAGRSHRGWDGDTVAATHIRF